MSVRKLPYTKPIPAGATITTRDGKKFARFERRGKIVKAELTDDGQRIRGLTSHYYGWLSGRAKPVKLATDKGAAEIKLGELKRRAELKQAGAVDQFEEQHQRPLTDHLEDFRRELYARARSEKYVRITCTRVKEVIEGCRFQWIADLSASKVMEWLADQRREEAFGGKTSNYYLRDVKSFCAWLVKDQRTGHNPLIHLSGLSVEDKPVRRILEPEEFKRFIAAASAGEVLRRRSGKDRVILYLLAANTGFRAEELASLKPSSFDLDGQTVTVEAGYSKRRRRDVQPIRPDLAEVLRVYLADRPAGELLWPGSWSNHGAELVREDLAAARAAWIKEAKTEQERRCRDESSYLGSRITPGWSSTSTRCVISSSATWPPPECTPRRPSPWRGIRPSA